MLRGWRARASDAYLRSITTSQHSILPQLMLRVISLNSCALLPDASCSTHVTCPVRSLEKNWYMCGRASLEQQLAVGTKHQVPRIPQPARSRHLHVGSLDPLDDQTKLHEDTEIDCVGKSDTPSVRTLRLH